MSFLPDHAYSLLARAWEHQRLAHAFLISGPDRDELHALAVRLAALVNDWRGAETLDDLRGKGAIVIEPESKIRHIKVDTMREAERRLQLTSDAPMKVCVVDEADRMKAEAANAFLKTLEEPPGHSLIILLTRSPEQMLETVRSRCVRLPLFRSMAGGLTLTDSQEELAALLAAYFSEGPPEAYRVPGLLSDFQLLLKQMREGIEKAHANALDDEVAVYGKTTDGAWLKDREDHFDDLTESVYQEARSGMVALLFTWLGEILRRRAGLRALDLPAWDHVTARAAESLTVTDLMRRLRAVDELRRNLSTTVREPLALEVAFFKAFG